jgi:signal transduction histidine kinase
VWRGDFAARVRRSPVADRDIARVGRTINLLLDGLTADRARLRLLASQIIDAQDAERARIARELHDSTAQTLAALVFQLSALQRASADPAAAERLDLVHTMATGVLEEVRTLSHTVHPRVLDDLGLVAALEYLARQAREDGTLEVGVASDVRAGEIPRPVAAVLYRVAQEALANVRRHSGASSVRISLTATPAAVTLEIVDDGVGFDVADAEARRPGMGLFSMRERVGLVDGAMAIDSAIGRGTRVTATVPLTHVSDS